MIRNLSPMEICRAGAPILIDLGLVNPAEHFGGNEPLGTLIYNELFPDQQMAAKYCALIEEYSHNTRILDNTLLRIVCEVAAVQVLLHKVRPEVARDTDGL